MTMISKCANPDCCATFDYRFGRFFRFHRSHAPTEQPANSHSVVHFWLCRKCSEAYTLEDRNDRIHIYSRRFLAADRNPGQRLAAIVSR